MGQKEVVLITGSSGLIGFPLCERLANDFDVLAFDREGPPHPPVGVDVESIDLTSDESVRKAMTYLRESRGEKIASIVHLAAYYDFSGRPSPLYESITVKGTERLLREFGRFDVGQFIFSSTMLVHAPCQPGEKINEKWPLQPKWDYPKSKVTTEQTIRKLRGRIPAVLMRIGGVYDDFCHSVPIAHQIQRVYERSLTSRVFPGDMTHGQSFVHLTDLLTAIERTIQRRRDLPAETALLIGEEETLGYDELQRTFQRLIHGEEWRTYRIPKLAAKVGAWMQDKIPLFGDPFIRPWMIDIADDHYALDISEARNLLGWSPEKTLRSTLPKMVAALETDPAGWYRANKLSPPKKFPYSGPQQRRSR